MCENCDKESYRFLEVQPAGIHLVGTRECSSQPRPPKMSKKRDPAPPPHINPLLLRNY